MPPIINRDLCNGCCRCIDICPTDVFFKTDNEGIPLVTYPDQCWHENACVHDCPKNAIKLRIPLPMMVIYK
jgi:adenylylsulfate reductase, subunit B